MVFLPKEPPVKPNYPIYKGYDPEYIQDGEMAKTVDWIEELGGISDKLFWAAKTGFKIGIVYSVYDILHLTRITDRRLQIARAAFFTVPAVAMTTGWMGGLEVFKKLLGRDMWQEASFLSASVPAGIYAVWRRRPNAAPGVMFSLGMLAYINQYAVDNNLALFHSPFDYNPNTPMGKMEQVQTLFGKPRNENFGGFSFLEQTRREPTWKKFVTEE